jgi:hypothetical protein
MYGFQFYTTALIMDMKNTENSGLKNWKGDTTWDIQEKTKSIKM